MMMTWWMMAPKTGFRCLRCQQANLGIANSGISGIEGIVILIPKSLNS